METRTGEEKLKFGLEEAVNILEFEKMMQKNRDRLGGK